jgi:hypothetical protein
MIDVTITEPSGAYICGSRHTDKIAGAAARQAEKDKHSKYNAAIAKLSGVNHLTKFIPFVMETHGSLGKEALNWLQELCVDQPLPATCLSQILSQISTALQIGNSEMSITGLNSLAHQAAVKSSVDIGSSDKVSEALRGFMLGRQKILWNGRNGGGRYRLRGADSKTRYVEVDSGGEDEDVDIEEFVVPRLVGDVAGGGTEEAIAAAGSADAAAGTRVAAIEAVTNSVSAPSVSSSSTLPKVSGRRTAKHREAMSAPVVAEEPSGGGRPQEATTTRSLRPRRG